MTVTLRDAGHSDADQTWIQSVYPEYIEELADISHSATSRFPLNGQHGQREPELLARWFRDDRSHPLVILDAGRHAGFALVSRPLYPLPGHRVADYRMAEFYVRRAARRRGVGQAAAALIFSRFAGEWEVSESMTNCDAVNFWRQTVMAYTHGRYDERVRDGEVRQRFLSTHSPGLTRP